MVTGRMMTRRAALLVSISGLALAMAAATAHAQSAPSVGTVDVQSSGSGAALPIYAPAAVGSKAPAGTAPALAPAQASTDAFEPGSIVSDKVIKDIIPPSSDYNETAKYTPGFLSNNANGLLGDSKGGWRGYQDGQFNITFDGIPFGDYNDPTHHSAAYFPSAFLGSVTIDRGPGNAAQLGYATYGGTLGLHSVDLSDAFGGNITGSFGTFNTWTTTGTVQSGLIGDTGVRSLWQYSYSTTSGALQDGHYDEPQFLAKLDKQLADFKITLFGTYGRENYNNVSAPTYAQWQQYGKRYGEINNNPATEQFYGWNNSQKQTDMEYLDIDGTIGTWHVDNKLYTYSYWYPGLQNNGANLTIEGANPALSNFSPIKVPLAAGGSVKVPVVGVANGDVVGYIKYNDYRAFGDIFSIDRQVDAGMFSGVVSAGAWWEHADNSRLQEYIDYTNGKTFPQLGNGLQESYKLDLVSHVTNYQAWVQYDWQPIDRLTIEPGWKFEAFTRFHDATVNQTTLAPENFSDTYTAHLPYLAVRYKLTPQFTAYAQASKGFLAPTVSAYYVFNPGSNNQIQPQETTNYQAGVAWKSEKATADFDVYQVTSTNFPVPEPTPTGLTTYVDGGTARYRGAEFEGSYVFLPNLSGYASAALIQAKYVAGANNGLRVGDAPKYTFVLGGVYDDGTFFGSLLNKWTGGYYGSSGQAAGFGTVNYVKDYNTTDFVIGVRSSALHEWGIGKNAEIKLGVYNIFDHQNITEIAGTPGSSNPAASLNATALTYSFLPGRLVIGTVKFGF